MASNLLFVSSSLFGAASQSRTIAQDFVDRWIRTHPGTKLVHRALSADSIPHLTLATFKAASTPADKRNAAESETAALADALIEELEAANVIVIAAPMYNLSIPSTLKAWIDHGSIPYRRGEYARRERGRRLGDLYRSQGASPRSGAGSGSRQVARAAG